MRRIQRRRGHLPAPKPPYYAVIFSSRRNGTVKQTTRTAAERMFELVQQQPGTSSAPRATRDEEGFGITVAYFDSEENIKRWRNHTEHAATRERGKREWYEHFEVRVAKVERATADRASSVSTA